MKRFSPKDIGDISRTIGEVEEIDEAIARLMGRATSVTGAVADELRRVLDIRASVRDQKLVKTVVAAIVDALLSERAEVVSGMNDVVDFPPPPDTSWCRAEQEPAR